MAAGQVPGMPSEAEMEQLLAQMREAPAEQVLVEVVNALLQAAQVKLGRPDARLLIDAVAAISETAAGRADRALVDQVGQAVAQLRMAQVQAEAEIGTDAVTPPPAPASAAPPAQAPPAPPPPQGAAPQRSRLWVPGT